MKFNNIDKLLNDLNLDKELNQIKASDNLKQNIITEAYVSPSKNIFKFEIKKLSPIFIGFACAVLIFIVSLKNNNDTIITEVKPSPRLFKTISAGKDNNITFKSNSNVPGIEIVAYNEYLYEQRWIGSAVEYPYLVFNNITYRLLDGSADFSPNINSSDLINIDSLYDYSSELENLGITSDTNFYLSANYPNLIIAYSNNNYYCFQKYSNKNLDDKILNSEILNKVKSVYYSKYGLIDNEKLANKFVEQLIENSIPETNGLSEYSDYILINIDNIYSLQIGVSGEKCVANGCFKIPNLNKTFENLLN